MEENKLQEEKKVELPPVTASKKAILVDFEKLKFTLNVTTILAIIIMVYQFTNFTWRSYYEMDHRIKSLEMKLDLFEQKNTLLNEKINDGRKDNDKMNNKLEEVQKFLSNIKK